MPSHLDELLDAIFQVIECPFQSQPLDGDCHFCVRPLHPEVMAVERPRDLLPYWRASGKVSCWH